MQFQVFAGRYNTSPKLVYDSLIINDPKMRILNPSIRMNYYGGSFSFTFPKSHYLWESDKVSSEPLFCRRTDYVIILKDGEWLWEGFPVSYNENINGDYDVICDGAYKYMDNAFYPLSNPLNLTYSNNIQYTPLKSDNSKWWNSEDLLPSFIRFCFFMFMHKMCRQYNDRINDLARDTYERTVTLDHQKIYCHPTESVIDVSGIKAPAHFSRIVNFESCREALQKRLADDFGGYFYITKKEIEMSDIVSNIFDYNGQSMGSQDNDNPSEKKMVLLLNYRGRSSVIEDDVIYLGQNLLDYNVSEDFDIATAVIPFGDPYNDDHNPNNGTGESRWWMKDDASIFNDIDQRATMQWSSFGFKLGGKNGSRRIYSPNGGSRVFLPYITGYHQYSVRNMNLVRKYGLRDVIVEFDEVAVKFPYTPSNVNWNHPQYGCPHDNAHYWSDAHVAYAAGSFVWFDIEHSGQTYSYLYACLQDHYSDSTKPPDSNPNSKFYWEQVGYLNDMNNNPSEYKFIAAWPYYNAINGVDGYWKTMNDYLDSPNYWDSAEVIPCDYWYIINYVRALRILSLDYLENQQFNNLILNIETSMITHNSDDPLDMFSLLGNKLPVASDLFGKNLKPYPVTEININIEDINSSTMTLGGEAVLLSSLLRIKQR